MISVKFELTDDEIRKFAGKARGYYRENPRVHWKDDEWKEACRLAIQQMVGDWLEEKKKTGL